MAVVLPILCANRCGRGGRGGRDGCGGRGANVAVLRVVARLTLVGALAEVTIEPR